MGLNRIRTDSIKKMKEKKTIEQLRAENEELREQAESLEVQLTDTQLALCDVYELLVGGDV